MTTEIDNVTVRYTRSRKGKTWHMLPYGCHLPEASRQHDDHDTSVITDLPHEVPLGGDLRPGTRAEVTSGSPECPLDLHCEPYVVASVHSPKSTVLDVVLVRVGR